MWRTLMLAAAVLLAGCGSKPDPARTARLPALEAENRDLRDRLRRSEREKAALMAMPAPAAAPSAPARRLERKESSVPLPDQSGEVSRLRSALAESQAAVTELEYPIGVSASTFPGIQFGEHVIWGLTLRVLASFAEVMQRTLPAFD